MFEHRPVMVDEVVAALAPVPAGIAGRRHRRRRWPCGARCSTAHPHLDLVGLDRDDAALEAAAEALAPFAGRVDAPPSPLRPTDPTSRSSAMPTSPQCSSTSGCPPRSSTSPTGASPTDTTDRSTCGMDRRQRRTAGDVVNGYAERRAGAGAARVRRRALRHPHRPGDRRRPPVGRRPPSWPTSCATPSRRPPAAPAATRPSGPSRPSASR